MVDYSFDLERMLRGLREREISDPRVLEAMRRIPRHLFVESKLAARSYREFALPIGGSQTISQPWVVARMTELLSVDAEHTVLEIGTGSGYQTAILALLARRVFSIERIHELAQVAIERMRRLDLQNVKIHVFDGTVGFSEGGPYDRILVTAGAPRAPQPLLRQLAPGGRMVVPEGDLESQRLVLYQKDRWDAVERTVKEPVTFVPLIGRHGWERGEGER